MKQKFLFAAILSLGLAFGFTSCEEDPQDVCSNELGDIQDDYNCEQPVMPQICTVDGVDDHWILDGTEYPCPDNDCTIIPEEMITAMQENYGCGTTKSADLVIVNQKISERAARILEKLRAESTLCAN